MDFGQIENTVCEYLARTKKDLLKNNYSPEFTVKKLQSYTATVHDEIRSQLLDEPQFKKERQLIENVELKIAKPSYDLQVQQTETDMRENLDKLCESIMKYIYEYYRKRNQNIRNSYSSSDMLGELASSLLSSGPSRRDLEEFGEHITRSLRQHINQNIEGTKLLEKLNIVFSEFKRNIYQERQNLGRVKEIKSPSVLNELNLNINKLYNEKKIEDIFDKYKKHILSCIQNYKELCDAIDNGNLPLAIMNETPQVEMVNENVSTRRLLESINIRYSDGEIKEIDLNRIFLPEKYNQVEDLIKQIIRITEDI